MEIKELSWKSSDGIDLNGRYWEPIGTAKGIICIVHGMGEHCARYDHVAEELASIGMATIGYDQRGHGKSKGSRGHTPSYEHLMNDVDLLISKGASLLPGLPLFLYGHSMGGNLVINYGLKRLPSLNGIISTSPWLKLAFSPPAIQVQLGRWMNKIYPAFTQTTKLDAKAISRDEVQVKLYEDDPLVHDKISSMMFLSIYEQGLWALENADRLKLPLLLCHGSKDHLTSWEASQEFAKKVNDHCTFELFEGSFHEIHNDLDKNKFFTLMKSWIADHL